MDFSLKYLFIGLVLTLAHAVFAFGGHPAVDEAVKITGGIAHYGNAPFVITGFQTADGKIYTLKTKEGSSFSLKDIESEGGNLLELTGEIDESHKNAPTILKDGVFIVSDWKKM